MESKESPKIRWFIYIFLAVLAIAVIFSFVFRIDEYSKMTGEVKTQENASSVLSSSNCKLKKILVKEGQAVKAGDTLFVLDSEYAKSQKKILEDKMNTYNSDLKNTELLKKSIEQDKNLFTNNADDSKFYYRFEQYKNGNLLTAQDIDNSSLSDDLSKEEQQNNLNSTIKSIEEKNNQINEYESLLDCIKSDTEYSGDDELVNASYTEFETSYKKANLSCEQYNTAYQNLVEQYNSQTSEKKITPAEVESAKQESDNASTLLNGLLSTYLSDVRSQILLIENQLITDGDNTELQKALVDYNELKNAIEQGSSLNSDNENIQSIYNEFITQYESLSKEYNAKLEKYQQLYNTYTAQNSKVQITEADLTNAKNAYEGAVIDRDSVKTSFISQIQAKISALNEEINNLESSKKSIELALRNVKDLNKYENLSKEKLKNEAIISVNSEISSLNDNIASLKSQVLEIDETLNNSEIKASVNGTVTLINNLSTGDIIQAGSSLCSIIPDGDALKVVLYIPESEISKVKVGQKTEYTIDAIPYHEYGKIDGEIFSVSADSIANESSGMKYYIAQASLSESKLINKDGEVREIKTGMLVEAKSISGSKRIITWLLEKLNFID